MTSLGFLGENSSLEHERADGRSETLLICRRDGPSTVAGRGSTS